MLKPVINIIHSESFSVYVTGGIGISYGMVLNPRDMNLSLKGELGDNKTAKALVSKLLNTTENPQEVLQQLLDDGSRKGNQWVTTLPNKT